MPRFVPHPTRRPAIVTGASAGIGESTAKVLAERGHPVVLGARRIEKLETTAKDITEAGGEAVAVRLDLGDQASIKDFVAAATEAVGDIEVVVNNAGHTELSHATDEAPDMFAHQMQVNFLGVQHLVSLVAPPMRERGRGDVIFVTTDAIDHPRTGMAAYQVAKWGLEGLARIMQMELEGSGVRVSIVRPGPTATEMGSDWDPNDLEPLFDGWTKFGVARHDCFLRPAQVADVIATVVAMPRGSYIASVEVQPEAPGPNDLQGGSE